MALKKKAGGDLKSRLLKKKDELKKGGGKIPYFIFKEGTHRMRPLPVGEENEWAVEGTFFYHKDLGGIVSPATFNEPCALMEGYQQLKSSKDPNDKDLAKSFSPKKRFFSPHIKYKDEKGKMVDEEMGAKLACLNAGQYNDLILFFLDEEEAGDFTDPIKGYDIKYTRTGAGQFDTEYSTRACKPTPLPKKYAGKIYDPIAMLREITPSYEETVEMAEKIFGSSPKKEKKKLSTTDKLRKKMKVKKKKVS